MMRPNFANPTGKYAEAISQFMSIMGFAPAEVRKQTFDDGSTLVVAEGTRNGEIVLVDSDGVVYDADGMTLPAYF